MDCNFDNLGYQTYDDTNAYKVEMILMDISHNKADVVIYPDYDLKYNSTILLYFSYLGIMDIKEDKEGIYTFKVSLGKNIWSQIKLSADYTLYDLHNCIQDAFDFSDDHLYSFFMDGKMWSKNRFTSSCDEQGPYVDEVKIGALSYSVLIIIN